MNNPIRTAATVLAMICATSLGSAFAATQAAGKVTDTTVELPSGKLFYRDSGGKGTPVIFLHAGSGNSMLWEYQIPAFTAAGYRFIAIDYRGVGSANAGPSGGNTAERINELVSKLNLSKFHLVGTAAGGGTALQYALANRDKLRSITITNSIGNVQDKEYTEMGNRIRPKEFNQLPLDMRELGPSYRAANAEGVKRWLALSSDGREVAGSGAAAPGGMGAAPGPPAAGSGSGGPGYPPVPGGAEGMGTGSPPAGNANNPYAVTWANLEKFTVPTLLMTGDADLYTPPSVLRMFTAHMKQAESAVIAETGHSSYWENPDVFNRTVLAFIAKH